MIDLKLQNINGTEEKVAQLYNELQAVKDENAELHQKLSKSPTPNNIQYSNDKQTFDIDDDDSFDDDEPVPSEHPSPALKPRDIEEHLDLDIELGSSQFELEDNESEHDQEEKQSSTNNTINNTNNKPTPSSSREQTQQKLSINTSSPPQTINKKSNTNNAITPSTLSYIQGKLNIHDLPIQNDDQSEESDDDDDSINHKTKNGLSELFVGGGKQYWKNVANSTKVENEFYASS